MSEILFDTNKVSVKNPSLTRNTNTLSNTLVAEIINDERVFVIFCFNDDISSYVGYKLVSNIMAVE